MGKNVRTPANPLLNAISGVLLAAGGIMFFFGDRFLRQVEHVDFWLAELAGIGGGVVLMALGGLLKKAGGSKSQPES